MTRLSVNVNKVATLRNARGGNTPDVELFAQKAQEYGAEGITVHPRPDERHIRREDVYLLKPLVYTEFNIEGNPQQPFVDLVTMPFADAFKMFEADAFAAKGGAADAEYCATVSLSLINLGCAAVLFTLGADGAYLRTSSVHPRLASMGALAATSDEGWWAREVYRPGAASPVAAAAGMLAGLAAKATPQALLAGLKLGAGAPAAAFAAFKAEDGVAVGPFNKVEA